MGIRGFHKYCKERIPNSHKLVNIMDSLEEHRKKTGKDPVVIINALNFINVYQRDNKDTFYGFRYNVIISHFEEFLVILKDANIQMIFPFCKSKLKLEMMPKQYKQKDEEKYKETCDVYDKIKKIKNVAELKKRFAGDGDTNDFNFWFPYNELIKLMLMNVAKKYGKCIGTSAMPKMNFTLRDQVKIAEEHDVFAVMGFDSHYLIHGGNWKYWSANDLNFDTMDTSEYDRDVIVNFLGLSYAQMPLFVVLTGCDLLAQFWTQRLRYVFRPKAQNFMNVAEFILKRQWPLTDEDWLNMGSELFPENPENAQNLTKILTKIYKTITWNKADDVNDELAKLVMNDYSSLAFEILTGQTITISAHFVDYRKTDMCKLDQMLLPLILKTAGLLLHHKEDSDQKLSVYVKRSHEIAIETEKIDLIYPEFDIPDIKLMLTGKLTDDEKYKLLSWIMNLNVEIELLKEIPSNFLFILLSLNYLLQNKTLKISEAIGILKTLAEEEMAPISDDIEYPETTDERAYRVSIIFVKFFKYLQNCATSIGFKDYEFACKFDTVYYQKHFVETDQEAQELVLAEDDAGRLKLLIKELKDTMQT